MEDKQQVDRELLEAMVADAVEEAQRRIEAAPPRIITVYGDDEAGLAPTPAQMEEARESCGPNDVIVAVAYTAAAVADAHGV